MVYLNAGHVLHKDKKGREKQDNHYLLTKLNAFSTFQIKNLPQNPTFATFQKEVS